VSKIVHGIIGWSNWRSGCEFYEDTERNGERYARWLPRVRQGYKTDSKTPPGRLLTDALDDPKGARVVVIVLAQTATEDDANEIADRARQLLGDEMGERTYVVSRCKDCGAQVHGNIRCLCRGGGRWDFGIEQIEVRESPWSPEDCRRAREALEHARAQLLEMPPNDHAAYAHIDNALFDALSQLPEVP
jgi:hypothetical protein